MIPWKEHTAPDGRKYYYNKESKESRWVMPEEMKKAAAANGGGGAKDGAGPAAAGWGGGVRRDGAGRGRSPADYSLLDLCAQSSHPRTVCTHPPYIPPPPMIDSSAAKPEGKVQTVTLDKAQAAAKAAPAAAVPAAAAAAVSADIGSAARCTCLPQVCSVTE